MALIRSFARNLFGVGSKVNIVVHAPEGTPPGSKLFVTGACSELGQWSPAARQLRQTDQYTWETQVRVPKGQALEFKVTRGSWETVERNADGSDTSNHCVDTNSLEGQPVYHTVQSWSDA